MHLVRRNYVEEVDETNLIRGAVRGMLAELDPHSSYLDPESHKEMQVDTQRRVPRPRHRDQQAPRRLHRGRVADRRHAGVARRACAPRDQIVAICPTEIPEDWTEPCRGTKSMTLFEAVKLMRGKRGSKITIEIFREGFETPAAVHDHARRREGGVGRGQGCSSRATATSACARSRSAPREDLEKTLAKVRKQAGGTLARPRARPARQPGRAARPGRARGRRLAAGRPHRLHARAASRASSRSSTRSSTAPSRSYPIVVLVNAGSGERLRDRRGRAAGPGPRAARSAPRPSARAPCRRSSRSRTARVCASPRRSTTRRRVARSRRSASRPTSWSRIRRRRRCTPRPSPRTGRLEPMRERDLDGHFTHGDAEPGSADSAPIATPTRDADARKTAKRPARPPCRRAKTCSWRARVEVLKSWTYFEHMKKARLPAVPVASAPAATPNPSPESGRDERRSARPESTRAGARAYCASRNSSLALRDAARERVGRVWVVGEVEQPAPRRVRALLLHAEGRPRAAPRRALPRRRAPPALRARGRTRGARLRRGLALRAARRSPAGGARGRAARRRRAASSPSSSSARGSRPRGSSIPRASARCRAFPRASAS